MAIDGEARSWVTRLGLPPGLVYGLLAVLIFMVGDGLEGGWLSKYIVSLGFTLQQSALLFTVYGIALAVASWFAGSLAEIYGARRVMMVGIAVWIVFEIGFLTLGIGAHSYPLMLIMYGLRGFGYPLFAFAFLTWIVYKTPPQSLGSAVGWFWFVFTGGLGTLGAYYSSLVLPRLHPMGTLWSSLAWVGVGGAIAVFLVKDASGIRRPEKPPLQQMWDDLAIVARRPKVTIGGVVRIINTAGGYGFFVFMPVFMTEQIHFTIVRWLQLLTILSLVNIFFNLFFGFIGDRIGWRNSVMWFGGVGGAIATLAMYYVPLAVGPNFLIMAIVVAVYGALLAGYVPLAALIPSLAPEHRGGAMAVYNFSAGLSAFVGPAIVAALVGVLHYVGIMWLFAALYLIGAGLTWFLQVPGGEVTARAALAQGSDG